MSFIIFFYFLFLSFFLPKGEIERLVKISRDLGIVGPKTALGEEEYKDVHIPMALARKGLRAVKEYRRPIAIKRAKAKAEKARADMHQSYDDNQGCNSIDKFGFSMGFRDKLRVNFSTKELQD